MSKKPEKGSKKPTVRVLDSTEVLTTERYGAPEVRVQVIAPGAIKTRNIDKLVPKAQGPKVVIVEASESEAPRHHHHSHDHAKGKHALPCKQREEPSFTSASLSHELGCNVPSHGHFRSSESHGHCRSVERSDHCHQCGGGRSGHHGHSSSSSELHSACGWGCGACEGGCGQVCFKRLGDGDCGCDRLKPHVVVGAKYSVPKVCKNVTRLPPPPCGPCGFI